MPYGEDRVKRIIKFFILVIFIFAAVGITHSYIHSDYTVKCKNNIKYHIKFKGIRDAVDFAKDENENFYIAYKNKIQAVCNNGKTSIIVNNISENIMCLVYHNNKLYFSSDHDVYCYDLKKKS